MRVLSLGWGVQSFTLAAMSALGELPPVDAAIHADTTHERASTYTFAARWTDWLEAHGVRVVTVGPTERIADLVTGITPPFYTVGGRGEGQLHRTCTDRWKIRPIGRWVREHRNGGRTEEAIGISLDEAHRMKPSRVKYIINIWPLVDLRMTRSDCARWLLAHDLEVPSKSSCVMCPYHDRASWREMQLTGDGDWQKALAVDATIRHKRPNYVCYLTPQRKPLAECDFSNAEDHGQQTLWTAEECTGYCFL